MAKQIPHGYDLVAYGGNAEDVGLMRAFADRRKGFFVDVGAGNPVSGSEPVRPGVIAGSGERSVR